MAATKMAEKSKILVIGGTGKMGRYIVEASAKSEHPTIALCRQHTIETVPQKAKLVDTFKIEGVDVIYGDVNDHESLINAIKQVDVVISCLGSSELDAQYKIIAAIKEAVNIKARDELTRFFPAEFAIDVDRVHAVEPAASLFETKAKIRRKIEAEGIPYTFVVAYGFASHFIPNLGQLDAQLPNIDKVVAYGDGNSKIICATEEDIATYTIKAVDDPRTLNKILYLRPPANIISFNELFALYEKKSGKTLEKTYISEEELLKKIEVSQFPANLLMAVCYSVSIKNDYANYEIEPSFGVEASELYPEVKYTTVVEILHQFI